MSACRSTVSALLLLVAAPAFAGEVATGLRAPSPALGREIEYSVHSPGGPTRGLPVVYLLHGRASDPDEWLRRLDAGAPLAEFLTRQTDLPVSPVRGSVSA